MAEPSRDERPPIRFEGKTSQARMQSIQNICVAFCLLVAITGVVLLVAPDFRDTPPTSSGTPSITTPPISPETAPPSQGKSTPKVAHLFNIHQVLGHTMRSVARLFGPGTEQIQYSPGEKYGFPNGATGINYNVPNHPELWIYVIYDTDGKAKEVGFDWPSSTKCASDDWKPLLNAVDMDVQVAPDQTSLRGQNWYDNVPGYHISMDIEEDGYISSMRIRLHLIRERGEAN